jgi:LysM repeat protein
VPNAKRFRVISAAVVLVGAVLAASADYVVKSGDTVVGIAGQYGVSPSDLASTNNLADPDLIGIGQILIIPGQDPPGTPGTHVVASGESLAQVAAHYGTTINALVEANDLSNPNLIRIGQQLVIAGSSLTPVAATALVVEGATHTVSAGETLAGIASTYGVTVEAIASANGITDSSVIYIGTVLRLSGEGFVATASVPAATVHTVAAGENLAFVAARYGTTINDLAATNAIADPNLIRAGQQLQVPSATPGWVCPVIGARYFNDWGYPRSGGRFHEGNDLFAVRGTAVLAPVSGTVIFQNGRIGGLQFRLYGGDGTTYIGTHLDTIGADGYVTVGAQLGTVGDSGNAIGSNTHLHFEIHPSDGPAVNPYPTLKKFGC